MREESKKLATMRAWFPFRDFLSTLRTRVENVDWTAKDLSTPKELPFHLDFNGRSCIALGCLVVEPRRVLESKQPEMSVVFIWPMDLQVMSNARAMDVMVWITHSAMAF
jgi:hypothetical protein